MAVGAYGSAVFSQKLGLPFIISVPLAGLIAGVVGVVIGFPALRIKGIYLLLLTLGFSEIIQVLVLSWDYVGGAQGYRNIPFNRRTLEWVVAVVVLLIFFFGRLERSSLGRAMDSIHQDETAAEVMGIDVVRIKLFAFGIGAGIAGVAGALYAHQATYIDSTTFNVMMSVEILTFVVVGGGSTYLGPVVGAVALSLLPQFLRTLREWLQLVPVAWTDFYPMNKIYDFLYAFLDFENAKRLIAYGLILIVMMIVRPDGLITRDSLPRLSFKRWKARHV
jgi:branched-chain amino acid transport system permease protein